MMNNLFSMFDPSTNMFTLNWMALLLPYLLLMKIYFYKKSRTILMFSMMNMFILKDLKNNIIKKYNKSLIYFISIFSLIYMSNLMSLMPFVFTPTSHMSFSLFLSLPFWISLMITGWVMTSNKMLTHLVPSNTPLFLCPFMVLIETISNIIRPLTLAIRLSANMIAGHILISLLSSTLNSNLMIFISNSLILNVLICLEMAVAVIQGYVFIILMSLYLSEINN